MADLTLADEVVVLMLDDADGDLDAGRIRVASVAIAGGIVMELALRGHIDTDLTSLFVVDPKMTGDQLLDDFLQEIGGEPEQHSSAWWIDRLSARHGELVEVIRARLVAAGILREEERRFLWMFSSRAYPQVSDREEREAKARLLSILSIDAVPGPRDTLLLSLARSTGILEDMLSAEDLEKVAARIDAIVALEEIGRAVSLVASQVSDAMTMMVVS
jgi:Golgi phosphoprotein 3